MLRVYIYEVVEDFFLDYIDKLELEKIILKFRYEINCLDILKLKCKLYYEDLDKQQKQYELLEIIFRLGLVKPIDLELNIQFYNNIPNLFINYGLDLKKVYSILVNKYKLVSAGQLFSDEMQAINITTFESYALNTLKILADKDFDFESEFKHMYINVDSNGNILLKNISDNIYNFLITNNHISYLTKIKAAINQYLYNGNPKYIEGIKKFTTNDNYIGDDIYHRLANIFKSNNVFAADLIIELANVIPSGEVTKIFSSIVNNIYYDEKIRKKQAFIISKLIEKVIPEQVNIYILPSYDDIPQHLDKIHLINWQITIKNIFSRNIDANLDIERLTNDVELLIYVKQQKRDINIDNIFKTDSAVLLVNYNGEESIRQTLNKQFYDLLVKHGIINNISIFIHDLYRVKYNNCPDAYDRIIDTIDKKLIRFDQSEFKKEYLYGRVYSLGLWNILEKMQPSVNSIKFNTCFNAIIEALTLNEACDYARIYHKYTNDETIKKFISIFRSKGYDNTYLDRLIDIYKFILAYDECTKDSNNAPLIPNIYGFTKLHIALITKNFQLAIDLISHDKNTLKAVSKNGLSIIFLINLLIDNNDLPKNSKRQLFEVIDNYEDYDIELSPYTTLADDLLQESIMVEKVISKTKDPLFKYMKPDFVPSIDEDDNTIIVITSSEYNWSTRIFAYARFIMKKYNDIIFFMINYNAAEKLGDELKKVDLVINPGSADFYPKYLVNFGKENCAVNDQDVVFLIYQHMTKIAIDNNILFWGICAGAQQLALYYGARLGQVKDYNRSHHHDIEYLLTPSLMQWLHLSDEQRSLAIQLGKLSPIKFKGDTAHNYIALEDHKGDIVIEAKSEHGYLMAYSNGVKAFATQYHPEHYFNRETDNSFKQNNFTNSLIELAKHSRANKNSGLSELSQIEKSFNEFITKLQIQENESYKILEDIHDGLYCNGEVADSC